MFLSAALFASGPASTITYSKRYRACSERAEGSYTHILACQGDELAVQEERLNRTYSALMRRVTPAERRLLRASELKWLRLRDMKCGLPLNPGNSDLVDSRECYLDETLRRIGWLERHR
jgi:uncharacterized protein YecT (DUF1311 family)